MAPSAVDVDSTAPINGSHAVSSGRPKSVVIVGAGPAGLMLAYVSSYLSCINEFSPGLFALLLLGSVLIDHNFDHKLT